MLNAMFILLGDGRGTGLLTAVLQSLVVGGLLRGEVTGQVGTVLSGRVA